MPGIYNLEVNQGATKRFQVIYKDSLDAPINLTGYQGRGAIKLSARDADPLALFTVTVSDPTGGVVDIELAATALESVPLKGRGFNEKTTGFYDIEIYNGSDVIRLLNGTCNISPEITK
jgi:hypothetical protein